MAPQISYLIEAFPAHAAAVRFLPGVDALVTSEVTLQTEAFPADVAGVRFLAAVGQKVAGVMLLAISGVLTLAALVPLFPRPLQLWVLARSVLLHEQLSRETDATNITRETW